MVVVVFARKIASEQLVMGPGAVNKRCLERRFAWWIDCMILS